MRRKLAIISEHASPLASLGGVDTGGQNVYVAHVARQLAQAGHQVDVFTRKDREDLPQVVPWEHGVRVVHVPAGPAKEIRKENLLPYMNEFTEFMVCYFNQQEAPYEIVHANFWMSGLVAAELKKALGIPFVITFHALGRVRRIYQGKNDAFPDERFEVEDRLVREADQIIAECPQDRQDLIDLYQAAPERITVIPCGFDPDELWPVDKQVARAFLGIPMEEKVALQLGRMVPRKGVDTAICGFARVVKNSRLPARMLVVGGESDTPDPHASPELQRLMDIACAERVPEKIRFTGRKDRRLLKYYYSAADVFISTPWYEPFGITPVEAMACQTPVIGSAVGGLKYTVENARTGFLVPPNDAAALASRLENLFDQPEKALQYGMNGWQRANQEFTWKKVTHSILETYEAVIRTNAGQLRQDLRQQPIQDGIAGLIDALKRSQAALSDQMLACAETIQDAFQRGNKVMICGNGGSAADAQHFAGELVGRFRLPDRPALPAIALNADSAVMTAWANDAGFEYVFSRQVEAFAQPGDVLIGISTSGNSRNLIEAFRAAGNLGVKRIALLGGTGGDLLRLCDYALIVPSADAQRIQEVQIFMIHMLCELIERHITVPGKSETAGLARTSGGWLSPVHAGVSIA